MIFDKKPALLLTPPPERTNHRASLLQNSFVGYRLNSVSRWIREFEREERPEARPRGHRASIFSDEERQELIELVGKRVDMTLEEMRSHFAKDCSLNAIHKLVKSPGFVFKKNAEGKQDREDIIQARTEWKTIPNDIQGNAQ